MRAAASNQPARSLPANDFLTTMKMTSFSRGAQFLAAALMVPSLAHAHVGVGPAGGFGHGFGHPLGGIDHLVAMLAVGLWAAQLGGRALWTVPATFVSVMALGGLLGMLHVTIPFTEPGIVLSVLTLGILIAAAVRLPLAASATIVGVFAIFHGRAHGAEMPASTPGLAYAAGFLAATALLHAAGISLGIIIEKISKPVTVRLAGVAVAVCGLYLLVG